MSDKSQIEWTDATWNPVRGCSIVSEGCRNCYAMRQAHRMSGEGGAYEGLTRMTPSGPNWTGDVREVSGLLDQPIRWTKPRRVFVNSMSDLFHPSVSPQFIGRVFATMCVAQHHTFQVLTKRPERMLELVGGQGLHRYVSDQVRVVSRESWKTRWPLPNVWLGVSVENQETADERIPLLLQTPAAVRWVSAEPLLGPVDLSRWLDCAGPFWSNMDVDPLDWIVVGGESGPGARPMHPDWAREIRDQCVAAGVPFHFKQWGAWKLDSVTDNTEGYLRVGKKEAGRELDGRTWDEFPEPAS